MSQIGPGGNNILYEPDKNCSNNSAITLTLKTWLKITAHPLSKGTLRVKYKPDWAKGREDGQEIRDGEMDVWMEGLAGGQTDHCRATKWNRIYLKYAHLHAYKV